jgi:hypothetical protein
MKRGEMNEQLAVSVGGGTADPAAAGSAIAPVVAVFVDATGRRRRLVTWLGWLVALACGAYLGVIGVSMTGTSVGPLPGARPRKRHENSNEAARPNGLAHVQDRVLRSILPPRNAVLDGLPLAYSERVVLPGDGKATVYVLRHALCNTVVSVVSSASAKRIADLCNELGDNVLAAMSAGFFAREARQPLGELWIAGERQSHTSFQAPWRNIRGTLHIDADRIGIDSRQMLPARPNGDLLQAGPLLVVDGRPVVDAANDSEGFRAGSWQFDSDITDGRYPNAREMR